MKTLLATLDRLDDFDEIVDVRTPLEYADDHLPGALNAPVLSNEERVVVGTLYRQSPFDATRLGAAMVARNIALHLDTTFAGRPRNWRPLIYCWRGGKRSGSMTTWFNLIGWQARQLDGGYKAWRHGTLDALDALPRQLRYIVLTGNTGCGKTRLLHALASAGAQALDLEGLAAHRGSLLGALPDAPQPSQKAFENGLVAALRGFDPGRPVFLEAESRRIGALSLPAALFERMHDSPCVKVSAAREARIAFLLEDYGHLFDASQSFKDSLARLVELHGHERIGRWYGLIDADQRAQLFGELIALHYDPAYARSSGRHYAQLDTAPEFVFRPGDDDTVAQARTLLERLAVVVPAQANAAPAAEAARSA